jgi:hypothetical protein
MKKCTFLVPLKYNTGDFVPQCDIDAVREKLMAMFSGFTELPTVNGRYRSIGEDGNVKVYEDVMIPFVVICDKDQMIALRNYVRHLAVVFKQECMYFETCDVEVDYLF